MNPMTWKKNPKFIFKLKGKWKADNERVTTPVKVSLGRHGVVWKSMMRKDAIGCMIGFYVFIMHNGELSQIYESTFSPGDEVTTGEERLDLEVLRMGEEYVIMPTTFGESKVGSFILTVTAEAEFSLTKEK